MVRCVARERQETYPEKSKESQGLTPCGARAGTVESAGVCRFCRFDGAGGAETAASGRARRGAASGEEDGAAGGPTRPTARRGGPGGSAAGGRRPSPPAAELAASDRRPRRLRGDDPRRAAPGDPRRRGPRPPGATSPRRETIHTVRGNCGAEIRQRRLRAFVHIRPPHARLSGAAGLRRPSWKTHLPDAPTCCGAWRYAGIACVVGDLGGAFPGEGDGPGPRPVHPASGGRRIAPVSAGTDARFVRVRGSGHGGPQFPRTAS